MKSRILLICIIIFSFVFGFHLTQKLIAKRNSNREFSGMILKVENLNLKYKILKKWFHENRHVIRQVIDDSCFFKENILHFLNDLGIQNVLLDEKEVRSQSHVKNSQKNSHKKSHKNSQKNNDCEKNNIHQKIISVKRFVIKFETSHENFVSELHNFLKENYGKMCVLREIRVKSKIFRDQFLNCAENFAANDHDDIFEISIIVDFLTYNLPKMSENKPIIKKYTRKSYKKFEEFALFNNYFILNSIATVFPSSTIVINGEKITIDDINHITYQNGTFSLTKINDSYIIININKLNKNFKLYLNKREYIHQ